jgi:hypothetical protein
MRDSDCKHYVKCLSEAARSDADLKCDNCNGEPKADEKPVIRSSKGILEDFRKTAKERLPSDIWQDAVPGMTWIKENIPTKNDFYPNRTHPDSSASYYINPDWILNDPRKVAEIYNVSVSAVNSHVPYDPYLGLRWYRKDTIEHGRFVKIKTSGKGRPLLKFEMPINLT